MIKKYTKKITMIIGVNGIIKNMKKKKQLETKKEVTIDRHGEVVMQNGWKLDAYRLNPQVLFAHESNKLPIAKMLDIRVDETGIKIIIMKSKNEEAKKDILEIMKNHVGVDNAITDKIIRRLINVDDPDRRKPTAGLRDVINALRQEGYPICSGLVGYWYAKDVEELEKNIGELDGRAIKIMTATKGMKKTLEAWKSSGQAKLI